MPKLTKNFSVKKAHETQVCLSKKIILEDRLPQKIRTVAGVDVDGSDSDGVVVVNLRRDLFGIYALERHRYTSNPQVLAISINTE